MATYKVIQDIEAEDKLLGPLTLRQFIYALITVACGYFTYLLASKGAGFMTPLFIIPGLFTAFFAFPWSREQPTEVWALAKLRFLFKPRKRIWNQSGIKELVTVTVPKKVEQHLTNGLSQHEVESRLTALAKTLDSRGWAARQFNSDSDRLIDMSSMPQQVPNEDFSNEQDMLDDHNNPLVDQFDSMIATKAKTRRDQIMAKIKANQSQPGPTTEEVPKPDYWFMAQNQPASKSAVDATATTAPPAPTFAPGTKLNENNVVASPEELAIAQKAKQVNDGLQKDLTSHIKTIQPLTESPAQASNNQPSKPVTPPSKPAIIGLANSDHLNVATIARQANKPEQQSDDGDEVVISLH